MSSNKQPKRYVAIVRITNSLKAVVPLLLSVSEATPYCAVMWDDNIIVGCFDYFGTESHLNNYTARVKLDSARLGFKFVDTFQEVTATPQAAYGTLVSENIKALSKISPFKNTMKFAESCLTVARRHLRDAMTYADIDEALASYDMIMATIATIKLRQVPA
jgi:hypothetical protein